jgi:hypothetical protein
MVHMKVRNGTLGGGFRTQSRFVRGSLVCLVWTLAWFVPLGVTARDAASVYAAAPNYNVFEDVCSKLNPSPKPEPALCSGAVPMSYPLGIAVDNSLASPIPPTLPVGDVYVASAGRGSGSTLSVFTAGGEPGDFGGSNPSIIEVDGHRSQLGFGVENAIQAVAVESATGDLYVTNRQTEALEKFSSEGEPISLPSGAFALPAGAGIFGIAVDNSTSPSDLTAGDVYVVGEQSNVIYRFGPTGELLGEIIGTAEHPLNEPATIAIDSAGNIYVAQNFESVEKFSSTGTWQETLADEDTPDGVAIDPSTGDILVGINLGRAINQIQPYTESGKPLPAFGLEERAIKSGGSFGLAASASNHFVYVSSRLKDISVIYGPGEIKGPPTEVLTGSASEVKGLSAKLNGKLNPDGRSKYYFEYGTEACTTTGACQATAVEGPLKGEAQQAVTAVEVTSLTPGTTYHYRLVGVNKEGVVDATNEETFKTEIKMPSEVLTEPAGEVKVLRAELNGKLNPGGSSKYYFEYGTKPCATAGACVKSAEAGPVTSEAQQTVTAVEVTSLLPGTTYYYRTVATNAAGTVKAGNEETFKTEIHAPSQARTEPASEVTATSAELNGEFNPGGDATYFFEYGTSPCGVSTCGATSAEAGPVAGEIRRVVEPIAVASLTPGVTYYYRLVAKSGEGTVQGEKERTFTTPVKPPEQKKEETKKAKEEVKTEIEKRPFEELKPEPIKLSIVKVEVRGGSLQITVDTSAQGTVKISGKGLKTTSKSVGAGKHQLKVGLSAAGKGDRKRHRSIGVKVTLSVGSQTVSASKTVKL